MAHIFKHPTEKLKGLVVFTHKEWGYFSGNKIIRKLKRDTQWLKILPELRGSYSKIIKNISTNYYISVTFAGFQHAYQLDKQPFNSEMVDLVISPESTLPNLATTIPRIPLNSRNFISKEFTNLNKEKYWDLITVGMNVKVKNYNLIFRELKKTLEIEPSFRCLLIVPSTTVKWGRHTKIAEDFYKTFSRNEQRQITFLLLHPDLQYGIDQHQLIDFYNRSHVFTLFSAREGESRVISEALCCGLPVVVYSDLLGGGRDLLTEKNSLFFGDYEKAHLTFLEARKKFKHGIKNNPEYHTREDHVLDSLKGYIKEFYLSKDKTFDGKLINTDHLDLRLPGHYIDIPWMLDPNKSTADILSLQQMTIFQQQLLTTHSTN